MKTFAVFTGSFLGLVALLAAAPLEPRTVELDPELAGGYFEGDMVLSQERTGLINTTMRWPNSIVYYKFNDIYFDDAHRNHILRGMQLIEEISCIRFQEATEETTTYVNITGLSGGCYSSVGYQSRVQTYNLQIYPLDSGCFRLGTIVHEFLHTLGFYHMQSASNRDDYVRIAEENITPGTLHNFNKYDEDTITDFGEEYDYGSVMHYSAYAFSANGEMTIVPLREEEAAGIMGQRIGMSQSDINRLNLMYKCPLEV